MQIRGSGLIMTSSRKPAASRVATSMGGARHEPYHIHRAGRPRKVHRRRGARPAHRGGRYQDVRILARRGRVLGAGIRLAQSRLRVRRHGLPPLPRAQRAGARVRRGRVVQDAAAAGRRQAQERPLRRPVPGQAAGHAQRDRGVRARRRDRGRARPRPRATSSARTPTPAPTSPAPGSASTCSS